MLPLTQQLLYHHNENNYNVMQVEMLVEMFRHPSDFTIHCNIHWNQKKTLSFYDIA